mgnify:CR=1 FL=1
MLEAEIGSRDESSPRLDHGELSGLTLSPKITSPLYA